MVATLVVPLIGALVLLCALTIFVRVCDRRGGDGGDGGDDDLRAALLQKCVANSNCGCVMRASGDSRWLVICISLCVSLYVY